MTSKAAILILTWTVFVGALHFAVHISMCGLIYLSNLVYINVALPYVVLCFFVALLFIFYPLSGYFADVYCGHFRTTIASLALLIFSLTLCLGCLLLLFLFELSNVLLCSVIVISLFVSVIGLAGYGANFIQFGLDQLLDAPSQHQAIFVRWAKWCYDLMNTFIVFLACVTYCYETSRAIRYIISASFYALIVFMLLSLLLFSCWKRHWFTSEPGHHNPYKTVIKVLNFARKHKHILVPSPTVMMRDPQDLILLRKGLEDPILLSK